MGITEAGTYNQINPHNIVLSEIKNGIQPRMVVMNKAYPIGLEMSGKAIFGVDMIFGKRYMKFAVANPQLAQLICDIEKRLAELMPGLKSSILGTNIVHTLFDRNVEITREDGNPISSFAIEKGTNLLITAELGNIYKSPNGIEANYKWLVKKIVILNE